MNIKFNSNEHQEAYTNAINQVTGGMDKDPATKTLLYILTGDLLRGYDINKIYDFRRREINLDTNINGLSTGEQFLLRFAFTVFCGRNDFGFDISEFYRLDLKNKMLYMEAMKIRFFAF